MPIFCVSDLHLCDRGPRDNFCVGGREERFCRFLDHVQKQSGRLFILGDLFDWWQVNLSNSINEYRKLLNRLWQDDAVYVPGNHDNALSNFIESILMPKINLLYEMKLPFSRGICGRHFTFLHGHEADPYCSNSNPGIGEITAIISGMLEDRNKSPNYKGHAIEDRFIGTLDKMMSLWRKLAGETGRLDEMINGVEEYRKQQGADVVVSGHTHIAGQISDFHYNCGSWCRDCDTFVRIEDEGIADVFEWTKNNRAVPYNKILRC